MSDETISFRLTQPAAGSLVAFHLMGTVRWKDAQENELAIWQRTASDMAEVFAEIAEAAAMVRFGTKHGVATSSSVLELGIGPMGIGWAAFASPPKAMGVDPLPRLTINTGNADVDRFISGLQGRTEYLQADATTRLPFDNGSFDLIVCDNVVDHAQDPGAILAEGRRMVRSDGRLIFGVNVFSTIGCVKWRQLTRRMHPQAPNVICHPHSFVESDLGGLLSSAGWEIIASDDRRSARQRLLGHAYRVRVVARPA